MVRSWNLICGYVLEFLNVFLLFMWSYFFDIIIRCFSGNIFHRFEITFLARVSFVAFFTNIRLSPQEIIHKVKQHPLVCVNYIVVRRPRFIICS